MIKQKENEIENELEWIKIGDEKYKAKVEGGYIYKLPSGWKYVYLFVPFLQKKNKPTGEE